MAEYAVVENRSAGKIVYIIPGMNIRKDLAPGQSIRVPKEEIEALAYTNGGMDLIKNYLLVKDEETLDNLNVHREPEYYMTADQVVRLLKEGSLDEFLDALDFAPEGVIDMIKDLSVQLPLNDVAKREALKNKTGYDIDTAIKNNLADKAPEEETVEKVPAEAPKRRVVQKARRTDGSRIIKKTETRSK